MLFNLEILPDGPPDFLPSIISYGLISIIHVYTTWNLEQSSVTLS